MNFIKESLALNLAADGQVGTLNDLKSKNRITIHAGATVNDGGGTLILQMSPDGGTTWVAVPSASWTSETANQLVAHVTAYGNDVRLDLSGATSPDLDLDIQAYAIQDNKVILAHDAETTNTNSVEFNVPEWVTELSMVGWGTWGSGTMKLQYTIDGGTTWKDVASGALTANGMLVLDVTNLGGTFRVNIAGGTAASLSSKIYF